MSEERTPEEIAEAWEKISIACEIWLENLRKEIEPIAEKVVKIFEENDEYASRRFDIIKSVEWCKWETTKETVYKCPSCENYKQQGHMAGCRLKKEIDPARLCINIEES